LIWLGASGDKVELFASKPYRFVFLIWLLGNRVELLLLNPIAVAFALA
jgi:hypothetical protein